MTLIAKCKEGHFAILPEGSGVKAGDMLYCPADCPLKNGVCKKVERFKIVTVRNYVPNMAMAHAYSESELARYFAAAPVQAPAAAVQAHAAARTQPAAPANAPAANPPARSAAPTRATAPATRGATADRYKRGGDGQRSGGNPFAGAARGNAAAEYEPKIYAGGRQYSGCLKIGGIIFTDDPELKRAFPNVTKPLKNALLMIFEKWLTTQAFVATGYGKVELSADFAWLLKKLANADPSKVEEIVSAEDTTVDKKFFYLFYDVAFKREPPKSFYWGEPGNVIEFGTKEDFMNAYCGASGNGFRDFYEAHKAEIMHYLGVADEERFFEDLPVMYAKSYGKIIYFNLSSGKREPENLGSIADFVADMKRPTNLARMEAMTQFLKKYRLLEEVRGGRRSVVVVKRSEYGSRNPYPFVELNKNVGGKTLKEDTSMYAALGLSASSYHEREYDCFTSLLREYCASFSPRLVEVGGIRFTAENYAKEIEELVASFCLSVLSGREDGVKRGRAWLARSIFERGVLANFVSERSDTIREVVALLDGNITQEKYVKTIRGGQIVVGGVQTSLPRYIATLIKGDVQETCVRLAGDGWARAFFETKLCGAEGITDAMQKLMRECQTSYKNFNS